ncbi:cysteine peptidase family C39 domain-containing protein [Streptomyces sp. NPDC093544]|uniref:cysteine peptidase family C39 domain-containing protein n=1 Tax=Streptomyces sp. NPDC093544 TaxID=3155200 RepID=UPI00341DB4F6
MVERQLQGNDCGRAALATVVAYYSRRVDASRLARAVPLNRRGTDLLALVCGARSLGLAAVGLRGPYESMADLPLPLIAHLGGWLGTGHFVVVHCWSPSAVLIGDPAVGVRRLTRRAFVRSWTGYVLVVAQPPDSKNGMAAYAGAARSASSTATPSSPL